MTDKRTLLDKLLIVAPPGVLAIVEVFHAQGHAPAVYETLKTQVDQWLFIHYLQLILFPLTAWSVYQLTSRMTFAAGESRDGEPKFDTWTSGPERKLLAIALAIFGIGYAGFDSINGIGTGVLVKNTVEDAVNAPPEFEQIGSLIVQSYYHSPLVTSIMYVTIAGAIAGYVLTMFRLHRGGYGLFPILMLAGACWGVTRTHSPPYGPITYGFVFAAAIAVMFFPPKQVAAS